MYTFVCFRETLLIMADSGLTYTVRLDMFTAAIGQIVQVQFPVTLDVTISNMQIVSTLTVAF